VKRPRILFLSLLLGRQGGLEAYNIETVKALSKAGADVSPVCIFLPANSEFEGVSIRTLRPRNSLLARVQRRFWKVHLDAWLHCTRESFDLIITGHLFLLPSAADYARRRGCGLWSLVFGIEAWNPWSKETLSAAAEIDRMISISRFTADQVRDRTPSSCPVDLIAPMVDADAFRSCAPRAPDDSMILLTVGRLSAAERYKGHDLVLQAMARLRDHTKLTYWIVGDGDGRPMLEGMARDLMLTDQVTFFGRVDHDELVRLYGQCDVMAMPSRTFRKPDGTWDGEGFGIVYLEAAAAGKPVIAASGGGTSEAVEDGVTGLLVNASVEGVAEALIKLSKSEPLRRRMGNAGRVRAKERFSRERFEAQWTNLLGMLAHDG
jgi:phosphatidyl-myo-inositol dimannoside synthase